MACVLEMPLTLLVTSAPSHAPSGGIHNAAEAGAVWSAKNCRGSEAEIRFVKMMRPFASQILVARLVQFVSASARLVEATKVQTPLLNPPAPLKIKLLLFSDALVNRRDASPAW